MPEISDLLLAACMFLGAALYTSVGHAGASAYIALMALFGVAPAVMRPTALALNILVASFTSFRYVRAGMFRWRVVWPFLLGAMPLAFIGGAIQLPGAYYRPIVGIVLLLGAARLLSPKELATNAEPRDPQYGQASLAVPPLACCRGSPEQAGASSYRRFCYFSDGLPLNRRLGSRRCSSCATQLQD
jgi:uncharacterized membrane protein YfcA